MAEVEEERAIADPTAIPDLSGTASAAAGESARTRGGFPAYPRVVLLVDALAIWLAALAAWFFRFQVFDELWPNYYNPAHYAWIGVVTPAVWILALAADRAYEDRFLGTGSEEFKRVANASLRLVALVTVPAYVLKIDLARRYLAALMVFGVVFLLLGRYLARRWLHLQRRHGRFLSRLLVLGSRRQVAELIGQIQRESYSGYRVVGAGLPPSETGDGTVGGVPVVCSITGVADALRAHGVDTLAVAASPAVTSSILRRLAWSLEGSGTDLLVAPSLTDVAGPRIHIRPVAGLPLLHVEEPELTGGRRLVKNVLDRTLALLALVVLLPVLLAIAAAIRLTSAGAPVFRQTRVGLGGETFTVFKFRTMVVDAEALQIDLETANEHDGVLFKIRQDPRITRVGRWLRRWSLDELPQLLNVLRGEMSLVGPRPPVPGEVQRYASDVHRRLLVKPGITGLWQVSGRADLSWDDTVRLDLYYVENWSIALDFMILWKTAFAVLTRRGAY